MNARWITTPFLALMLTSGQALAQDAQPALPEPAPDIVDAPELQTSWSGEEIAKAADMLIGSWKTTTPLREFGTNGETEVVMSIAPAQIAGLSDMLYVEIARADEVASPYRQAFYQLYRFEDGLRLRTYDLRSLDAANALLGMAFTPELFPQMLSAGDVYPTMDIDLSSENGGFSGASPAPYPDHRGGAVQMESTISFDGDSIRISDVGYNAEGEVAWEVGQDSPVEFQKADDVVEVEHWSDGLVVITFNDADTEPVEEGDFLVVDYVGKLSSGQKFDASFDRGEPFRYQYPGQLIQGWMRAVEGMSQGDRIRVFIPSQLGYGERQLQVIPPNSDLIFDIECVFVEDAPAQAPQTEPAGNTGRQEQADEQADDQGDQ